MTRSEAREQAFILIFEKSFNGDVSLGELYEMAVETEIAKQDAFTEALAYGVCEKQAEIDPVIEKYSVGWKIARMSTVAVAVLRLAVYEILYTETPVGVAINEAVELSKKYASKEDCAFVNGVLGSVAKEEKK